jgi:hypothetical protein
MGDTSHSVMRTKLKMNVMQWFRDSRDPEETFSLTATSSCISDHADYPERRKGYVQTQFQHTRIMSR